MKVHIFENETKLKIPFKNKTGSKCYKPISFVSISIKMSKGICKLNYTVVAVGLSRILKGKQKVGVTFNSDKLGRIDFTKFSKLTMCSV